MTIYQHRAIVSTSAGNTSTVSLDVQGGLCRQVYVKANTSTTVFMVNVTDYKGYVVRNYGFNTGELNDITYMPMVGNYTINITNASPNDTFKVLVGIEE